MSLEDAIKFIGENIPAPGDKMIDQNRMKLVWAWYEFLTEYQRLEKENLKLEEGGADSE